MQKERQALQEEIARAMGQGNDPAMQKAILALQVLDDSWIEAYNTLLLPGETRLILDETFTGTREGHLHLDLRFTGKRLPENDPFGAMVALTTGMENLAEGEFSLQIDQMLLKKIAPEAELLLSSMAQKGLASFEKGTYRLQGALQKGKIIIHGTPYAPQDLIMKILL
jgi:hypothetical protein